MNCAVLAMVLGTVLARVWALVVLCTRDLFA